MATTENAIQGRIGNMIYYRVKSVTRIRSVPISQGIPDSLECRNARLRLIAATRFYQRLQDNRFRNVWRIAAENTVMNGYNLFMKQNIHAFNARTLFAPANLLLISGTLPPMNCPEVVEQTGRHLVIAWTNSLATEGTRANDCVGVAVLRKGKMYSPVWLDKVKGRRREQRAVIDLEDVQEGLIHLYCFFVTPDRTAYSPSSYLCINLKSIA